MASGEFVGLLDHDDLLAPNALYEIASALEHEPDIDVLYTDEDKVRGEGLEHFQPHFKPDFNPDLLRSNNYICHFFVARRSLIEKVGGFSSAFDGAQDHDFIFRCTEQAGKIHHIPEIMYHWRTHQSSTADNPESKLYAFEAGKRAVEANLHRCGPVSYTHLDVYKRQNCVLSIDETVECGFTVKVPKKYLAKGNITLLFQKEDAKAKYTLTARKMQFENSRFGRYYQQLGPKRIKGNIRFIATHGIDEFRKELDKSIDPFGQGYGYWAKRCV